jgi:hypothetical protein
MQLYIAYKIKTSPYFGNFSGTGAGKTLSAVLASRVIDSKMTLIVCPNDVVAFIVNTILSVPLARSKEAYQFHPFVGAN